MYKQRRRDNSTAVQLPEQHGGAWVSMPLMQVLAACDLRLPHQSACNPRLCALLLPTFNVSLPLIQLLLHNAQVLGKDCSFLKHGLIACVGCRLREAQQQRSTEVQGL
jgi:hypothetical protein